MKTTLKDIKNTNAIDVTYLSAEELYKLEKEERWFNEVAYSAGTYGITGKVVQGRNSGKLYKACSRTVAVFIL